MKTLLLIALLFAGLQAQELSTEQVSKLHNYNHSISGKLRYKRALQKMATISLEKAQTITNSETNESIEQSKLKQHGTRLFYSIQTANHALKIDALDGSIISKERLE
jgi:uncharacterized membrane protein YkoI